MSHAAGIDGRQLATPGCFVDIGRNDQIRNDSDLGQQVATSRRGRSEDKNLFPAGHLALHVRRGSGGFT